MHKHVEYLGLKRIFIFGLFYNLVDYRISLARTKLKLSIISENFKGEIYKALIILIIRIISLCAQFDNVD